jgi:hypothetical protein
MEILFEDLMERGNFFENNLIFGKQKVGHSTQKAIGCSRKAHPLLQNHSTALA